MKQNLVREGRGEERKGKKGIAMGIMVSREGKAGKNRRWRRQKESEVKLIKGGKRGRERKVLLREEW